MPPHVSADINGATQHDIGFFQPSGLPKQIAEVVVYVDRSSRSSSGLLEQFYPTAEVAHLGHRDAFQM